MHVIDSTIIARDSREKPVSTFSHPALKAYGFGGTAGTLLAELTLLLPLRLGAGAA
jgi:hypothetical protein